MNEKKDKWEQLTEIPQDYEVNPDLIKKAESAMRQERRTTRLYVGGKRYEERHEHGGRLFRRGTCQRQYIVIPKGTTL